jgi:hypothetical protein
MTDVSAEKAPRSASPVTDMDGKTGFGKFEYVDQTLYIGEWKLSEDGKTKVKHGEGKINYASTVDPLSEATIEGE